MCSARLQPAFLQQKSHPCSLTAGCLANTQVHRGLGATKQTLNHHPAVTISCSTGSGCRLSGDSGDAFICPQALSARWRDHASICADQILQKKNGLKNVILMAFISIPWKPLPEILGRVQSSATRSWVAHVCDTLGLFLLPHNPTQ